MLALAGCRSNGGAPQPVNPALPTAFAPIPEPKPGAAQFAPPSPPATTFVAPGLGAMPEVGLGAGQEFTSAAGVLPAQYVEDERSQLAVRVPAPKWDEPLRPNQQLTAPPTAAPPAMHAAASPREFVTPPPAALPAPARAITVGEAVRLALEANPDLIVQRQELGVAGAARSGRSLSVQSHVRSANPKRRQL